MNREIQLLFSALLIAPLDYILVSDYASAGITGFGVGIAFMLWKYRERIRSNPKLMYILKKIFI